MRHFFLSFILFFLATGIKAQTLDDCRRLAREHYPEIRQYDLISRTEQFNLSNAAKAWIPQIAVSGQATYQSAVPAYPEALKNIMQAGGVDMSGTGMNKDQYRIAVEVNQNIWDGGYSKANRAIAEAEAAEQRSRVDVSLYDLQSRIDGLYFGVLLLDERAEQSKVMIEVLESNLSRMRTYHENGVALQSDVDMIEAELLTAQQQLDQVESSRASYRSMLELFIGQPLASDKLERPAAPTIRSYISKRPEFALLDAPGKQVGCTEKGCKLIGNAPSRCFCTRLLRLPRLGYVREYGFQRLDAQRHCRSESILEYRGNIHQAKQSRKNKQRPTTDSRSAQSVGF